MKSTGSLLVMYLAHPKKLTNEFTIVFFEPLYFPLRIAWGVFLKDNNATVPEVHATGPARPPTNVHPHAH
jgi:hypothetical protein